MMELSLYSKNACFKSGALALLVILAYSISLASCSCADFKVLNGAQDVTDQVCKKEYLTQQCLAFITSFDVSRLPDDVMTGLSVQEPSNLDVIAAMTAYDEEADRTSYYPTLRMSWNSPQSGNARNSIKGFFIWIKSADNKQTECRVFTIDHSQFVQDKLQFQYDLERVSEVRGRNYSVKAYSLPLPQRDGSIQEWMGNRDNYVDRLVTTKNPYSTALDAASVEYPNQWTTSLSISPSPEDRTIDVWFTLPDPSLHFKFTDYVVFVADVTKDHWNPIDKTNYRKIIHIPPSSNATRGHVQFTNLPLMGWYRIFAYVDDPYFRNDELCQCFYKEYNELWEMMERKCESCPTTRSGIFDLYGDLTDDPEKATHRPFPPPVTTTIHPSDADGPDTGRPEGSTGGGTEEDEWPVWVYPVGLSGLALTVCMAGFLIRKGYKKHNSKQVPITPAEPPRPGGRSSTAVVPRLSQKKVYLLSSPDHEFHQEMLKQLKIFLQTHCRCQVVDLSDLDANEHNGVAAWLVDKLIKCDLILLFDSSGAHQRLEAYVEHQEFCSTGPHRDLFNLGLRYVYNEIVERNCSNKAIIISLTEERCKERFLGAINEYVLPRELSFFLQQLHNIKPHRVKDYKSLLPMTSEFPRGLPCVPELLDSIKKVTTYEKQNPDWFSSHFELIRTKPKLERPESKNSSSDSNYESMIGSESNRSVTPPFGSSANVSPISADFVHPRFPSSTNSRDRDQDQESCITLHTGDLPEFVDVGAHSGRGGDSYHRIPIPMTPDPEIDARWRSCNGTVVVPPVDRSQITHVDNTSVAIGCYNYNSRNVDEEERRMMTGGITKGRPGPKFVVAQQGQDAGIQRDHDDDGDGTISSTTPETEIEIGGQSVVGSPGDPRRRREFARNVVPPIDPSQINIDDDTSVVIGCFNRDTTTTTQQQQPDIVGNSNYNNNNFHHPTSSSSSSTSSSSSSSTRSGTTVPPCNISEIHVDNLSTAIGVHNQNGNLRSSDTSAYSVSMTQHGGGGGGSGGRGIRPPIDLSDVRVDSYSTALEESNYSNRGYVTDDDDVVGYDDDSVNNVSRRVDFDDRGLASDGCQQPLPPLKLKPPVSENPSRDHASDGFSEFLNNNNTEFIV